ncbi:MAG: lysophospholipid acyltransferase family protein [Porticoccaceae bacterium]|nr:1-acyl-sn-glycerol-3-phosphate acyltransferase [Pseudomonadales bacterium]MCP5172911.1 1-acyl-sn-glycerol-3-phosphate acyltransferase [Pseudomonadales bacterium]MCP5302385.1 1-acyl-sn-glycerol-3-phosphate acyltransferase [Pseudomonadales bacterium]
MPLIRSILFYAGYIPIVIVFATFGCTIGAIMPYRMRQNIVTWANALVVRWLNLSCGIKLRIEGLENLPKTPAVIMSKHQSSWETYYLQRILRPVSTILKKELFKIPFFGWGLYFMHPIAIDRDNPRKAMKQVQEQGLQRLKQGNNVLVYPEGTRVPFGTTGKYARSGASLAIAAQVPVIPVAHNAGYCWEVGKFIKRPGVIHLVIGPAISSANTDSRTLTHEVQTWIESTQQTLSHS